ncbi:NrdH-redoxin [Nocardia sp. NBC_01503]|uniref:glutaredoxin domain-containing protein n=1 Tax=Nocardia sp. NBC_01503 TaxID=2975997 RepID=UPI002E7B9815|nr:glutaredoxin domain-containing protein [Nocardia sp. NBC_01503]WTL35737.1 NrdH-redoxin [Nocardia sp. NBC_01503]
MTAETTPELVVYRRPGCPFCARLRRVLNRNGIIYREVDIWDDPEAAAFVRTVADGNETVPTVKLKAGAKERYWVNPRPQWLLTVINTDAPALTGGPKSYWPIRRDDLPRPRPPQTN